MNRIWVLVFCLLFLFLCGNVYAVEIVEKQWYEIRGVQVFVLSPAYAGRMDGLFREFAERGVNTVYLRVFHNKWDGVHFGMPNPCPNGGVYFATQNACVVADLLDEAVAAGHKNGIKVYAWMATRSLSFLKTPENMSLAFQPDGKTAAGYGASIFNSHVRQTIKNLIRDLARTKADGILIQDDFIIKYTEGAEPNACRQFTRDTGIRCSRDTFFDGNRRKPDYYVWNRWKAVQLQNFLQEIRGEARLINPNQMWAVNIYYETPVHPDWGLMWYSHDVSGLWDTGVDYLAVMAYREQIRKEMKFDERKFLHFVLQLGRNSVGSAPRADRALIKVQSRHFDKERTPVTKRDFDILCETLKIAGVKSLVQLPVNSPTDIIPYCM